MAIDATTKSAIDSLNQATANNAALTAANQQFQRHQTENSVKNNSAKSTAKLAESVGS